MKVVVRGEKNNYSNQANSKMLNWLFSFFFVMVGSLFFGLGLWVMITEEVFTSAAGEELFVSLMSTFLGGIAIAVGIYSHFRMPQIINHYDLMQSGHCVKLPIVAIEDAGSYLNDVPGFYIECRNLNDEIGCMDVYRSDVIYNVRCAALEPGDLIPVYVDWRDPNRFYMDVDSYEKQENMDGCTENNTMS